MRVEGEIRCKLRQGMPRETSRGKAKSEKSKPGMDVSSSGNSDREPCASLKHQSFLEQDRILEWVTTQRSQFQFSPCSLTQSSLGCHIQEALHLPRGIHQER